MNSESEVEGGRRARFVFMLVVTEVFIAPPTHREREREKSEGGRFVEGAERKRRKTDIYSLTR